MDRRDREIRGRRFTGLRAGGDAAGAWLFTHVINGREKREHRCSSWSR